MKNIIFTILVSLFLLCANAEENRFVIEFEYPQFKGDFYVSGRVSFPPGAVLSDKNFSVHDSLTQEEIPVMVEISEKWPDGSILDASVHFAANSSRRKDYVLSYGEGVNRSRSFTQVSTMPIVTASIGNSPSTEESLDMEVGQLIVKVDRSVDFRYYWYLLPMFGLLFLAVCRARRNSKS